MKDETKPRMFGHVLIKDSESNEILVDKENAIHMENMSVALAKSLSHRPDGHIHEMHFGNGGSTVSGIGVVTYLPPNTEGQNADLYNGTYSKVIDDQSPLNPDPNQNFLETRHVQNATYSDIIVTVVLDFNEPSGQAAFDDSVSTEDNYIFDEIGLKTFNNSGNGLLLSHVIFNPVQKSLNRLLEITYTIRISLV